MATVNGVHASKMWEIFDATIVSASINESGHLILEKRDGTFVDAGISKGADGISPAGGEVAAVANKLVLRDASGRAYVATPVDDGQVATKGYVDTSMPSGAIMMWEGDTAPASWYLMDGSSHDISECPGLALAHPDWVSGSIITIPDRRNRMPVGAGDSYNVGDSGGNTSHAHTMPSHSHNLSSLGWARWATDRANNWMAWHIKSAVTAWVGSYRTAADSVTEISTSTTYTEGTTLDGTTDSADPGDTNPSSNMPPYWAVGYIIKA